MKPIDVVTYAVPFFVILVLAEMIWAARRAPEKYEPRDTLTSLALGLGSTVAGALTAGETLAFGTDGLTLALGGSRWTDDRFTIQSASHNGPAARRPRS